MELEALKQELKVHLINYLNLQEIEPEMIKDDEPFFAGSLDLDSIDSLEMTVMIEREYGLKLNNPTEARKVLVNINTMAQYILENRKN
ncbi:phosphopantetheine-binding protein [Acetobacteroides hydrogenigenes]|uniref:Acyl carrier protein n=1 Tax=Acetobacteroides hydrogenigenes TaxID=979970 RepID=A0A4R2ESS2_9BACT|nr:phosphopantetheine-binding protein [Acetobacteroides hydrogenigenes]TCN70502.1 acyl carrier protein [Acetobacteroides hydrogenigenes]